MNYLFDIGHPGQVHLFRHTIAALKDNGHKVIVTVKEIPSAIVLLEKFNIDYISLGRKFDSILLKGFSQFRYNYRLFKIAQKEKIDIGIGSSITVAHVSRLHRMPSIVLDDDDPQAVKLFAKLAHPFAHTILSPAALAPFRTSKKDITYAGSHELFYLHPKYFKPDPLVLNEIGLGVDEPFFVLRFVAVKAYHDLGEEGLTIRQKQLIIEKVKPYGKVFITSEKTIEAELEQYKLPVSPEKIHHLLYYAKMFIGDSQTMTSEAAILGTPALKCNSFAHRLSLPNLLEDKYDLCYAYCNNEFDQMISKIDQLLKNTNLKSEWQSRANKFIGESINPTLFLVWFIENYSQSAAIMKENPNYQYNFK
jgi:uncharacterized protein